MWSIRKQTWEHKAQEENLTFFGKGMVLNGSATFEGTVRIESRFEGNLRVNGTLIVGTEAVIKGSISAQALVSGGTIFADIAATQKVHLLKSAVLVGDVTSPSFVIEDGAQFNGQCHMGHVPEDKWLDDRSGEEMRPTPPDLAGQRNRFRPHHVT